MFVVKNNEDCHLQRRKGTTEEKAACDVQPDASHLRITIAGEPDVVCTHPKATPGSSGWIAAEYSAKKWSKLAVAVTACPRLPPSELVSDGCKGFKDIQEDCTNKDFFIFQKDAGSGYIAPTYKPDQYGSDAVWATLKVQDSEWKSSCVAYVSTGGGTCKAFCESNGKTCVRAMDDAHHQTAKLSQWLETGGYKPTDCTLLPSGHTRQSQELNGCNQNWATQICACN